MAKGKRYALLQASCYNKDKMSDCPYWGRFVVYLIFETDTLHQCLQVHKLTEQTLTRGFQVVFPALLLSSSFPSVRAGQKEAISQGQNSHATASQTKLTWKDQCHPQTKTQRHVTNKSDGQCLWVFSKSSWDLKTWNRSKLTYRDVQKEMKLCFL